MNTRVKKWGNSLALRIPKTIAIELGLRDDTEIELKVVNGNLIIVPLKKPEITVDDLLADITPENLHDEFDTGFAVGREAW